MLIQRRSFLIGLASALAAPAIVRAANIMPIGSISLRGDVVATLTDDAGNVIQRLFAGRNGRLILPKLQYPNNDLAIDFYDNKATVIFEGEGTLRNLTLRSHHPHLVDGDGGTCQFGNTLNLTG